MYNFFNSTDTPSNVLNRAAISKDELDNYLLPDISSIVFDYLAPYDTKSPAVKDLKKRVGSSIRRELTKGLSKEAKKMLKLKLSYYTSSNYFILLCKMKIAHFSEETIERPILIISRLNLEIVQYFYSEYPFSTPPKYSDLYIRDLMYQVRNHKDLVNMMRIKRKEVLEILNIEN